MVSLSQIVRTRLWVSGDASWDSRVSLSHLIRPGLWASGDASCDLRDSLSQLVRPRLWALLLGATLAGCGTAPPVPQESVFSLAPPVLALPATKPLPASLLVNDLGTRGFLGGRQILFRTEQEPLQVQRYQVLLWEEPVPRALAHHLADAIDAAGLFEFVLIPADRGRPDYILGGEVGRFEHLPTADPPRVAGSLSLSLVRAQDRRLVLSKDYRGEIPVLGTSPADMAAAFNQLATTLAAEVVGDLRTWQVSRAGSP